jgi:hypothetical protein
MDINAEKLHRVHLRHCSPYRLPFQLRGLLFTYTPSEFLFFEINVLKLLLEIKLRFTSSLLLLSVA